MKVKTTKTKGGFTLIELLIVIGLLGALTALILPRLAGERDTALLDVCDYNQAGTARTLAQYAQLYGVLPDAMHTGLETGGDLMGMPEAAVANFTASTVPLTQEQANSLIAGGLVNLAYDGGYNPVPVAAGLDVCAVTATWVDDAGGPFTFRGRTLDDLGITGTGADGILIAMFITPTIDWESGYGSTADWSHGNMQLAIDLEGSCPIPLNAEFRYYIAYVKAFNDGSPARLIGTSCPEHGILNP